MGNSEIERKTINETKERKKGNSVERREDRKKKTEIVDGPIIADNSGIVKPRVKEETKSTNETGNRGKK